MPPHSPRAGTARAATEPPAPPADTAEPPYYQATEDLYVWDAESGAMPQLAYRAGDRVAPDVVAPNGWQGKVAVPAHFAGQLAPAEPPAASPAEPAGRTAGAAADDAGPGKPA